MTGNNSLKKITQDLYIDAYYTRPALIFISS